jgi:hypothetical protein
VGGWFEREQKVLWVFRFEEATSGASDVAISTMIINQ